MSQGPVEQSGPQPTRSSWRFRGWLLILALFAFALRWLHIHFIGEALGDAQIHDAAYYHDVAAARSGGLEETRAVPFANQGYIRVLQVVYALFGPEVGLVLLLQAKCGALAVIFVGAAARRLFASDAVGYWAAGLLAVYAPAIHFDALLLIPSISLLLSAVGLYFLARALERDSRTLLWVAGVGLSVGAAAALRPSQLLLLPLCVFVLAWPRVRRGWGRLAAAALVLTLGVGAGLSPLLVGERLRVGEWIPASANAGMNLWTGNHAGASGTYQVAPFAAYPAAGVFGYTIPSERDAFLAEARRRVGDPELSLRASSRFWLLEAGREISADPTAWARLMSRKFLALMNDYEPRTNAAFDLTASVSAALAWDPIRFGVLLLLATLGLVLLRPEDARAPPALLPFIGAPFLTCLVFFVSAEYRNPAAPALAALAGFGLHQAVATLRGRRGLALGPLRKAVGVVAIVLVGLLSYRPVAAMGDAKDRRAYAEALSAERSGGALPERADYERARRLLTAPRVAADPMVQSSLLLVESNLAIQFEDEAAAHRFIKLNRALWKLDDESIEELGPFRFARIRGSQMLRAAQLCAQPHIREWRKIQEQLQYLGCQKWSPAAGHMERGDIAAAETFIVRSEAVAPGAMEVLAYRGWIERMKGNDPVPWLERSLKAHPRTALPAILLARHYVEREDWLKARKYANTAIRREPNNQPLVLMARRILNSNPWTRAIKKKDASAAP